MSEIHICLDVAKEKLSRLFYQSSQLFYSTVPSKLAQAGFVQVMENLEKHEINPFALENFAEKRVLKLVEPFSSHRLAVWQHKTWRN